MARVVVCDARTLLQNPNGCTRRWDLALVIDSEDLTKIAQVHAPPCPICLAFLLKHSHAFRNFSLQSAHSTRQEVVFQNGQFVVEDQSAAAELIPDMETSKRVFHMLRRQFDRCALTIAEEP